MPTLEGEKREGGCNLATRSGLPVYEEQWHFRVRADSKTQDRTQIIGTPGLPIPGENTSAGGFALCSTLNAERDPGNPLYWNVTATFSSEVEDNGLTTFVPGKPGVPNPIEWVPVYETKMERTQRVATKDRNGDRIANSAGQAFETGLTIGRYIPIWDLFQFEPDTVTDEQVIDRNETVNSVTFKGKAAGTLLLTIVDSVIWRYLAQRVRLTRYEVRYNKENWKHKRLDVGTQYLDAGTLKDFKSDDNSIMLGSLDGSGGKQAAGTAPAVLEFDVFDEVDFHDFLRT
jgi:hypothetical protein